MDREKIFAELRTKNQPVPIPIQLPTELDIEKLQNKLNINLHSDLKQYLLQVSDVVYGVLEPVILNEPRAHNNFEAVYNGFQQLKKYIEIEDDLIPICEDNGDFYAMDSNGKIKFISHDGMFKEEEWPNIQTWIKDVWLKSVDR